MTKARQAYEQQILANRLQLARRYDAQQRGPSLQITVWKMVRAQAIDVDNVEVWELAEERIKALTSVS